MNTRATASTITDNQLEELYDRLDTARDLLDSGYTEFHDRVEIVRRLCAGEITAQQARAFDRGDS